MRTQERKSTRQSIRAAVSKILLRYCSTALLLLLFYLLPFTFYRLPVVYGAFGELGVGARPLGMGNAYVALSDDVYSIHYNPAGMLDLFKPEFSFEYARLFWGLSGPDESSLGNSFVGFVHPEVDIYGTSALGLAWKNLHYGNYYQENSVYISHARKISDTLSMGLNTKILSISYGSDEYTRQYDLFNEYGYTTKLSLGFDLGVMYNFVEDWYAGLAIKNINSPNVGLSQKPEDALKPTITPGICYGISDLNVTMDIIFDMADVMLLTGVEKWLQENSVALRGGLNTGTRNKGSFSVGFGYYYKEMFNINYGFVWNLSGIKDIYGTHRISLSYKFNLPTALSRQ